jgi:hypothetical protein
MAALLGTLVLRSAGALTFAPLSWSDEIAYAVMGRNVAEGRGLVSGFYDADSITEKGYPLGDVHMPGQALAIAAAFRLLGVSEDSAVAPARISFLLAGLVVCWAGARHAGAGTGVAAAILLYLFPGLAGFAHSAMAELPLVLVSAAYFAVWLSFSARPRVHHAALLALLLGLGAAFRESFLVLGVAALLALGHSAPARRVRDALAFAAVLAACLVALVPLYAGKAPYPHFLGVVQRAADPIRVLRETVLSNLGALARPPDEPAGATLLALCALCLILPAVHWKSQAPWAPLSRALVACFLASYLGLVSFYPLQGWAGVRALYVMSPLLALLAAAALARLPRAARAAALLLVCAAAGLGTLRASQALAADRRAAYRFDDPFSSFVQWVAAPYRPRVVLAELAFLYGWRAYPVSVVWRASAEPAQIRALEAVVPLDLIVVSEPARQPILDAVASGLLRGGYRLVEQPARGVHVFVSARKADEALAGGRTPPTILDEPR